MRFGLGYQTANGVELDAFKHASSQGNWKDICMILTLLLSLLASLRVTIIDKYTLPIGVDYLNRIANTGRFENKVQSHSLVFNEMNSN